MKRANQVWTIIWQQPNGEQFVQSFAAENREAAYRIAQEAEQQSPNELILLLKTGKEF